MDVLESSRARLRATISLTNELASGDFPHTHSRDALRQIAALFESGLRQLETLTAASDPAVIRALASAQSRKLFDLYPLLGILLRSTDVRNAFEIHGPFLRIVRKLLGPASKLVISSEWDFSPFTFLPPTVYGLTDTVFIGGPASEAANVLLVPLSGHELGHNVWAKEKRGDQLGPALATNILQYLKTARWPEFSSHFTQLAKPDDLEDLLGEQTWAPAWESGLRQCEEMFCDLIGLGIFRESYLHAFSYLIAPGLPYRRSYDYPGSKTRATYLLQAAAAYGIPVPTGYSDRFEDEAVPTDQPDRILLETADHAVMTMLPTLIGAADASISGAGIQHSKDDEVAANVRCFAQCVPAVNAASFPSIINAAWRFHLSGMQDWKDRYRDLANSEQRCSGLLNDLVLKSVEVFEIEQRQQP